MEIIPSGVRSNIINTLLREQQEPIRVCLYAQIARAIGCDRATVRNPCFAVDGGYNGFAAIRRDLNFVQAHVPNRRQPRTAPNSTYPFGLHR